MEELKHLPHKTAADLIGETFRFSSCDTLLAVISIVLLVVLSFVYDVTATAKETHWIVITLAIVVIVMTKPKQLLVSVLAHKYFLMVLFQFCYFFYRWLQQNLDYFLVFYYAL